MDTLDKNQYELVNKGFGDLPQDYFEKLPVQLIKRSRNERRTSADRTGLMVAASFVLLLSTAAILLFTLPVNTDKQQTAKKEIITIEQPEEIDFFAVFFDAGESSLINHSALQAVSPLPSDSLNNKEISFEEILVYLIEKEEFEF